MDHLILHQGNMSSITQGIEILNDNQKFIQNTAEFGHWTYNTGNTQHFLGRLLSTNNNSNIQ